MSAADSERNSHTLDIPEPTRREVVMAANWVCETSTGNASEDAASLASLIAGLRAEAYKRGHDDGFDEGICK